MLAWHRFIDATSLDPTFSGTDRTPSAPGLHGGIGDFCSKMILKNWTGGYFLYSRVVIFDIQNTNSSLYFFKCVSLMQILHVYLFFWCRPVQFPQISWHLKYWRVVNGSWTLVTGSLVVSFIPKKAETPRIWKIEFILPGIHAKDPACKPFGKT